VKNTPSGLLRGERGELEDLTRDKAFLWGFRDRREEGPAKARHTSGKKETKTHNGEEKRGKQLTK